MTRSHDDTSRARGCTEYRSFSAPLSRRRVLAGAAGLVGAAAVSTWLPRTTFADTIDSAHALATGGRDVLVSIFLRGGADGLTLCVPHVESEYYRLRPTLAVARPDDPRAPAAERALDLDGRFGLPPALGALREAYDDGALAIVHACGLGHPTRSHFDAMRYVEVGVAGAPLDAADGWLGRHLRTTVPLDPTSPLRAVALQAALPRMLAGAPSAVPVPDPASYGLRATDETLGLWRRSLESLHSGDELLAVAARRSLDTVDRLRRIDVDGYRASGGVDYPETELGAGLRATAALIDAEVGLEAATVDLGGWDTHEAQGSVDGALASRLRELGDALAAFYRDVTARDRHGVTVLVVSEFGRNAFENGSRGTDHGHAGVLFALGAGRSTNGILGGRVVADWPGLAPEQLYEGQDLARTIDVRDVLGEALLRRAGRIDLDGVFPDPSYTFTDRGIFVDHASPA